MKLDIVYNKSCQRMDELPNDSIDCVMTSPPYWGLRNYGVDGQLGLEPTFQLYLDHMAAVCAEVKRVLKKTGSFWLNMGDTYSASSKCLVGIPWRLALRLVDEQSWILRNAIIWNKPNHMPSSVKDRCSNGYEFLFHLVKAKKYYYDLDAIREPYTQALNRWGGDKLVARGKSEWDAGTGQDTYRDRDLRPNKAGKNPGDVWTIPTQPRPEAHFATFPDKLCEKPIKATCPENGVVLDPFAGRGTTLIMAKKLGRHYVGYELKKEYCKELIEPALRDIDPLFRKEK